MRLVEKNSPRHVYRGVDITHVLKVSMKATTSSIELQPPLELQSNLRSLSSLRSFKRSITRDALSTVQTQPPLRESSRRLEPLPTRRPAARSSTDTISRDSDNYEFHQRVDRHGRKYGTRVSTRHTRIPPPVWDPKEKEQHRTNQHGAPERQTNYSSPPFTKQRTRKGEGVLRGRSLFPTREEPVWRAKRPEITDQSPQPPHAPVEPIQEQLANNAPTTEEVLEDLHNATALYLSCPNPTEAAARRQRVLQVDSEELLAKTAAGIIASASGAQLLSTSHTDTRRHQPIPSQEVVMQELQEVTLQYLSCVDPIEKAARQQRVLQGDASGLMEKTVERIIATTATASTPPSSIGVNPRGDQPLTVVTNHTETANPARSNQVSLSGRRRVKPARLDSYMDNILTSSGGDQTIYVQKGYYKMVQRIPPK
ncbi:hypothetical protein F2Q69_00028661 [Brassica cretica]|uniref:Uncharacterized protein n=1 Tax=Brassica cretica TaxID=69181 RepID=A0A8S9S4F0_BRACR|nr:hypothetical protein F2Q69_00028661 [Brassica cretica]